MPRCCWIRSTRSPPQAPTLAVCRQERVTDAAEEREAGVEIPLVQVVKKQTAHTAGLVTVRQKKVLVAPLFVFRINVLTVRFAGRQRRAMLEIAFTRLASRETFREAVFLCIIPFWAPRIISG